MTKCDVKNCNKPGQRVIVALVVPTLNHLGTSDLCVEHMDALKAGVDMFYENLLRGDVDATRVSPNKKA